MAAGKLIIIEGSDGSGKATQTELLRRRLRTDGRSFCYGRCLSRLQQ